MNMAVSSIQSIHRSRYQKSLSRAYGFLAHGVVSLYIVYGYEGHVLHELSWLRQMDNMTIYKGSKGFLSSGQLSGVGLDESKLSA